jgi:lipoprotein-releasing system permease protein
MYKLFLCLHYLRSRVIAYFAVLGVALCVAMMVIPVSVMNGFLRRIEVAAKGLFGDIIVEAKTHRGLEAYDAFIAELTRRVPEIEAASPFILGGGVLRVPGRRGHYWVRVAGIRLPERAAVSDFEEGLFVQAGMAQPTFDPPRRLMQRRLAEEARRLRRLRERLRAEAGPNPPAETQHLIDQINASILESYDANDLLTNAARYAERLRQREAELAAAERAGDEERIARLEREVRALERAVYEPPPRRIILGLGIPGLGRRTEQGDAIRAIYPAQKVILDVLPTARALVSSVDLGLSRGLFSVCDDCLTGVASIDRQIVYVPFERLQTMSRMDEPNRCTAVHVKVRDRLADERKLRAVAAKVERAWLAFARGREGVSPDEAFVQTWRQRQAPVVGPIESQRTLVIIMFGIIASVSVVLIFVIFYMIVVQKTREIGVLKAVGASNVGVAGIFLGFGALVGLVGAALGTVLGWVFVRNINPIHDWVGRRFGFVVWNREWFMFDKIPNEVRWQDAALIVAWAVVAGLLGALLPALRAARMQPVEAVRYE